MRNYIDEKGNYINCENLSLREIYERGKKDYAKALIDYCDKKIERVRNIEDYSGNTMQNISIQTIIINEISDIQERIKEG